MRYIPMATNNTDMINAGLWRKFPNYISIARKRVAAERKRRVIAHNRFAGTNRFTVERSPLPPVPIRLYGV